MWARCGDHNGRLSSCALRIGDCAGVRAGCEAVETRNHLDTPKEERPPVVNSTEAIWEIEFLRKTVVGLREKGVAALGRAPGAGRSR